jgi:hypothetical protein
VRVSQNALCSLLILLLCRPLVPKDSILRLPDELLIEIAQYLNHVQYLFCFGATHTRIWECILPSINPWAAWQCWGGHRLAVLGDYMKMDDFPSGVLDDDELATIAGDIKRTLYDVAEEYPPPMGDFDLWGAFMGPFDRRSWENQIPKALRQAVKDAISIPSTLSGPAVLRNLSKRLFIRSTALEALTARWKDEIEKDSIRAVVRDPPTLGNALILRICWSSDSSCSMLDPRDDLTRGPWTGDRFDIVLEEEFENAEGDWENVSDDICERLHEIRKEFWSTPW